MIRDRTYTELAKLHKRAFGLTPPAISLRLVPPRIATVRRRYSCAMILLGVLGVFGFALSAISPDDDDSQSECICLRMPRHHVVRDKKDLSLKSAYSHTVASAPAVKPSLL